MNATIQGLKNTVELIGEKVNGVNRIRFAYKPVEKNNIDQIKNIWKCFFDEINRVDIAIECAELTPHEIIEIAKSFQEKFKIIELLARAEIIKREGKRHEFN